MEHSRLCLVLKLVLAQISFGSGTDSATFNGAINAATIYGGAAVDTYDFNNIEVNGATIAAGAGADILQGSVSIWNWLSFWGGGDGDSFAFDYISNAWYCLFLE